jgi:dTDP-4-dehydrorhamnose 3,5-epimerase
MLFIETKLQGAFIIDVERREDNRGFFGRLFCQDEFSAHGLKPLIAQANVGSNISRGTIRGMHFQ